MNSFSTAAETTRQPVTLETFARSAGRCTARRGAPPSVGPQLIRRRALHEPREDRIATLRSGTPRPAPTTPYVIPGAWSPLRHERKHGLPDRHGRHQEAGRAECGNHDRDGISRRAVSGEAIQPQPRDSAAGFAHHEAQYRRSPGNKRNGRVTNDQRRRARYGTGQPMIGDGESVRKKSRCCRP